MDDFYLKRFIPPSLHSLFPLSDPDIWSKTKKKKWEMGNGKKERMLN